MANARDMLAGVKTSKKKGKKGQKFGRKHRNGKPFNTNGGCGCITCRR